MDLTTFVRKPFTVEAIEVTEENIEEIAGLIGELREDEGGKKHIRVDRRKVPNIFKVEPGFWMTKMETSKGTNIRCYAGHIFKNQFARVTEDIDALLNLMDIGEATPAQVFPDEGAMQNVGA